MHSSDFHELQSIQAKLDGFDQRCATIMALLGSKKSLSPEERSHAEELYRLLKEDLRNAAKLEPLAGEGRFLRILEFLGPHHHPADDALRRVLGQRPAQGRRPVRTRYPSGD